jgi:hypothetical protein
MATAMINLILKACLEEYATAQQDGGVTSVILFPTTYFLETWNVRFREPTVLLQTDNFYGLP